MHGDPSFSLPPADSPTLSLVRPTLIEKRHIDSTNGQAWKGRLSLPSYIRREEFLSSQALTRGGGITVWILVDTAEPALAESHPRRILASCESIRKRAFIKLHGGEVREVISHGIASVFCDSVYRRRGYARRMLVELGKKLDTWQQREGQRTTFTVLYSDIGKKFYSAFGWKVFPSTHISLAPVNHAEESAYGESRPSSTPLYAADIKQLCQSDEKALWNEMRDTASNGPLVALVPDLETLQWHHAREEFVARELHGRSPEVKGALTTYRAGKCPATKRVWCIWTRTFGNQDNGDVLDILRIAIPAEKDDIASSDGHEPETFKPNADSQALAIAHVLRAAQVAAGEWGMKHVQAWNPTAPVVYAARLLDPAVQVVERENESITSLRWHEPAPDVTHEATEWVGNEKFGWC